MATIQTAMIVGGGIAILFVQEKYAHYRQGATTEVEKAHHFSQIENDVLFNVV